MVAIALASACHPPEDTGLERPPPRPTISTPGPRTAVAPGLALNLAERLSTAELVAPQQGIGITYGLRVLSWGDTSLRVDLDDGAGHAFALEWTDPLSVHVVPLLGMRPDRTYDIVVTVDGAGWSRHHTLQHTTPPVPEGFPEIDVLVNEPSAEPAYLMFDTKTPETPLQYVVILDQDLEMIWYHAPESFGDVSLTPIQTLVGAMNGGAVEMDFLGNYLAQFAQIDPGNGGPWREIPYILHHEVTPLDGGHILALAHRSLPVAEYPIGYGPVRIHRFRPAEITDEGIIEMDRRGQLVQEVWLSDILDTHRIGYDSLNTEPFGYDWAHANAVARHNDGRTMVSLRHQDAVIELDADGELSWYLGNRHALTPELSDKSLTPVGDANWPWHQHAPTWLRGGGIVMFDNNVYGASPYSNRDPEEGDSRVVAYSVDPDAGTFEQLWEFSETVTGPLFCLAFGDADPLPETDHVLATFGTIASEAGVKNIDNGWGDRHARIIEFDPETGDTHLDIRVRSDVTEGPTGWRVYRSDKIERLWRVD